VRVVNKTVVSNRGSNGTGNTPLAVQTFRNDPDSGGGVTNEVGGASPSSQDAVAQADGIDLSTITAQSVTEIVISGGDVNNVDFGFNFDTIVNPNDADQGSLRQFILNSNELDNINLDQENTPAGVGAVIKNPGDEHSIFMIPAAELVATIDGGAGTTMLIQPSIVLPTITDDDTALDGSTQTAYTGDTNTAVAEVSTGPEIIVDLQRSVNANVLQVTGNGVIIDSMGLGRPLGSSTVGLYLDGVTNGVVLNSTIWDTGDSTISLNNSAASNQILNNVIRNAGLDNDPGDGISLLGDINSNTISGNTIIGHAAYGIDFITSSSNNNIVTNNLIKGNGTSASAQDAGIGLRFGDNNTFSQNTITENAGEGLFINTGNAGNIISQNSIFNNGGLGADLSNVGNEAGDGVTANDNLDPDGGGNERQNFPVITSAVWNGANTVVQGTLNSTAGTTFDIEVFSNTVCNGDTGGVAQADPYGEGETYRATDNVTTDGVTGDTTFTVNIPVNLTGQSITATATNMATNDTSEFSQCEVATAGLAVTSAVAEISPNDVPTGSPGNGFFYDILATINAGDTGVDRVTITVPASFGAPIVTNVQVGGTSVPYTDNTAGNTISVDLTVKITSTDIITVLFSSDAPGAADPIGQDFISTVDDSTTGDAAHTTTEGNADGYADANSWRVTTTDRSGVILLVVPDAASLSAEDAAKRALIESWGYTVTPISASASQAAFDAAVVTADAAYISEEINSGDLNTKMTNACIGVVNDEDRLADDLGFAAPPPVDGFGLYTSDIIDITDNSHYITQPFAIGSLSITNPAQPLHTLAGTIAPGAQFLAEQPSSANGTLVVIEAGDALATPPGGVAAGRRVYLPWGGSAFTINSLTAGGELLMRQAIEWAIAGTSCKRISGTINEDINGDANLGDVAPVSAAAVSLYLDDGNNIPDGADGTSIASATTDASGNYTFKFPNLVTAT
jgi:hypothetical protein